MTTTQNTNYTQHYNRFISEIYERADGLIEKFLLGYFAFGILISFFYDTWLVGISVGALVIVSYYLTKYLFPKSTLKQYVASAGIAIFMGQFIYQMHGMFEMHFFAFIGATLLISYQNWKTLIPLATVIVIHHGIFGWLQYQSFTTSNLDYVYFTQLDYMDFQTFVFHISLAVVIIFICGIWSYDLNKRTKNTTQNIVEMEELSHQMEKNIEYAAAMASDQSIALQELDSDDIMGATLRKIHEKLKSIAV